jgi:DNA-directed RNA polymerase subunit N (RpoN/RPB10)
MQVFCAGRDNTDPPRAPRRVVPHRGAAMLVPVTCFSCNRRVGGKWIDFCALVHQGQDPGASLDALGIQRICCRRILLTSVELNSLWVEHERVESEMTKIQVERHGSESCTVSTD